MLRLASLNADVRNALPDESGNRLAEAAEVYVTLCPTKTGMEATRSCSGCQHHVSKKDSCYYFILEPAATISRRPSRTLVQRVFLAKEILRRELLLRGPKPKKNRNAADELAGAENRASIQSLARTFVQRLALT